MKSIFYKPDFSLKSGWADALGEDAKKRAQTYLGRTQTKKQGQRTGRHEEAFRELNSHFYGVEEELCQE